MFIASALGILAAFFFFGIFSSGKVTSSSEYSVASRKATAEAFRASPRPVSWGLVHCRQRCRWPTITACPPGGSPLGGGIGLSHHGAVVRQAPESDGAHHPSQFPWPSFRAGVGVSLPVATALDPSSPSSPSSSPGRPCWRVGLPLPALGVRRFHMRCSSWPLPNGEGSRASAAWER